LATTRVHGFILPAGHETLYVEDDPKDDYWEVSGEVCLLSYIDWLDGPVLAAMQVATQRYRVEYSHTTDSFYFMNACEHCDAQLGDHYTFNEYGTGFEPASPLQAAEIHLRSVREPFSARAGVICTGVEYFDAMTRV
jgi:hypothetical protein